MSSFCLQAFRQIFFFLQNCFSDSQGRPQKAAPSSTKIFSYKILTSSFCDNAVLNEICSVAQRFGTAHVVSNGSSPFPTPLLFSAYVQTFINLGFQPFLLYHTAKNFANNLPVLIFILQKKAKKAGFLPEVCSLNVNGIGHNPLFSSIYVASRSAACSKTARGNIR